MRTRNRLPAFILIIGALILPASAAVAAGPAGSDPARRADPGSAAVAWAACPYDDSAECGTLTVPVDWASPDGATFGLAVARRKATDPAARIGSLIVNPGGPGASGTAFALRRGFFSEEITRRFDIVGFDPRGVGNSNPVICSTRLLNEAPRETPTNQAEFDRLKEYNGRLGADCRARTGPVFDHVDTLSTVRDLDAVRQAVGEATLSYYGLSYGTLLGQQYAEQFPDRVRALALDSNMDHSLGTEEFLDSQAATAQDSFNEFVAGCRRDKRCALHGLDIHTIWADLLERARNATLHDPSNEAAPISEIALVNMAFGAFYRPTWSELATNIKSLYVARPRRTGAPNGDRGGVPRSAAAGAAWHRAAAGGGPAPESSPYSFSAVFCQDWSLPVRDYPDLARHLARMAAIAPAAPYSPLALGALTGCLGWPGQVNNPQHPLRVAPDGPALLMVNAAHDPATGHSWAVSAAGQLGSRARLVTYEGWGHTVYGRERCSTDLVDRYLVNLSLPAPGTRCAAAPVQWPGLTAQGTAPPATPGPNADVPGWS